MLTTTGLTYTVPNSAPFTPLPHLIRYLISVPHVGTTCRYHMSVPHVCTTCRYHMSVPHTGSTHGFPTLVLHIGSTHWFHTLVPHIGSTYWFHTLVPPFGSAHWCRKLVHKLVPHIGAANWCTGGAVKVYVEVQLDSCGAVGWKQRVRQFSGNGRLDSWVVMAGWTVG